MMEENNGLLIPVGNLECRNCHESGGELIAPCMCSGSIKYVHRTCLNDWRAYSPNPTSFSNCDVCGFKYELRERDDLKSSRVWRFALYVTRDFVGSVLLIQAIVVLFSVACYYLDPSRSLLAYFPESWHKYGVYYIWGLFFFSVIVSIYGGVVLLFKCCGKQAQYSMTYDTYPYYWGPYFYWFYYPGGYSCCPMCYCGQGACNGCSAAMCSTCSSSVNCGGSSNNNAMTILGLVVMAIAIAVGFIMMVVIATVIIRRHATLLHRKQDARELEVVDLEEQNLDITSI
jgi:hypothetical protein